MAASTPDPKKTCNGDCANCRASRDAEPDIYHLGPVGIVRAEMLAAVDELMVTFRARG